ncbi:uncharacterized protein LOC129226831 [Uloborus diversus]|uniref:uncharacterized protein LOC129226831 n=1 Tax=Uloborus diversus TaxID=327109 RepID=UPI0024096D08|nr:uncharacterized protein LOC129226831 [Uloborus diversus]
MVPLRGYINSTNYSADAIRWLDYVATMEGICIAHALNGLGEKKLSGISVDGYCESLKTVYQYHVNKYCRYPVGHPIIITENFDDPCKYFGIIKCKVLAPRGLFLPILPYRCKDKLMFPLCRSCTEHMSQENCTHQGEDRALIGTWCTEELKLAIKKGYKVMDVSLFTKFYHFESSTDSLFKSYIDLFLKIKQESSGWPVECVTDKEKEQYIRQYAEKEGVHLDISSVMINPGRRQVAKLALNSFWGR